MRCLKVTSLAILGLTNTALAAADRLSAEQQQWFSQAQKAAYQHSFSGRFVYERKGIFSSYLVFHRVNPDQSFTRRYVGLDDERYELVRDQRQALCVGYETEQQTPLYLQDWVTSNKSLDQLADNYRIRWLGESRVAGRLANTVQFQAKDGDRYSMQLKLDQLTGIPLQSLLLNAQGQLLERQQFVSFEATEPQLQKLTASASCLAVIDGQQVPHVHSSWEPKWVPSGFRQAKSYQFLAAEKAETYSRIYTDGMVHFSVFVEPNRSLVKLPKISKERQLGPTSLVSFSGCSNSTPEAVITVLGELPMTAIKKIAQSVCPQE